MSVANNDKLAENELWQRMVHGNDKNAREQLIEMYMPLARKISARLFSSRYDSEVEFLDYLQFAHIGLIEAVDKYSPVFNNTFSTYATYRISGAVLNGVIKLSEKHEQISLQQRLKKERTGSIIQRDKIVNSRLFNELADVTIGLAISFMLEDTQLVMNNDSDEESVSPYSVQYLSQLKSNLLQSLELLNEKEKEVIKMHYFESLSFTELAEKLSVTKGRVSQLHRSALLSLRHFLHNSSLLDTEY